MSASPRFSQFDVYFFYLYHYGTDGRKDRGNRARLAENNVPFHRSARHRRKAALQMNRCISIQNLQTVVTFEIVRTYNRT